MYLKTERETAREREREREGVGEREREEREGEREREREREKREREGERGGRPRSRVSEWVGVLAHNMRTRDTIKLVADRHRWVGSGARKKLQHLRARFRTTNPCNSVRAKNTTVR